MSLGLGVLLLLKEVCVLFLLNIQIHIKSDLNFLFRKNYILKKVLFCVSMTEIISSVTLFTGLWSNHCILVVRSKIPPNGYLHTQARCMVAG